MGRRRVVESVDVLGCEPTGVAPMAWWRRIGVVLAVCAVVGACGGESDTSGGPDAGSAPEDLRAVRNPDNILSRYVEWETERATPTELTVECGDDWRREYASSNSETSHSVFVAGLWAGASCRATVGRGAEETGEAASSRTIRFEVASLPEFLPELDVSVREPDAMQNGWTLVNLTNSFDGDPMTVAVFDSHGRYRWYHRLSTSKSGADNEVRRFRNGVLVGGAADVEPRWIDWTGDIQWREDIAMHHDIRPLEEGDRFMYLGSGRICPGLEHSGDAIAVYDRTEERDVYWLDFCSVYQPPTVREDWDHLNTIEPLEGESAVLVSARNQHTIFKVDLEARAVDWKMGLRGDFGLSDEEQFLQQHAVEKLANGNLLMFDNGVPSGKPHARTWSRAIEIAYDPEADEARIVWSYRPEPDLFAPIWGDADRLSNGNTLVTFGVRNKRPAKRSRIVEVGPEGQNEVWRIDAANKWGWYRADRIESLPTGRVLSP